MDSSREDLEELLRELSLALKWDSLEEQDISSTTISRRIATSTNSRLDNSNRDTNNSRDTTSSSTSPVANKSQSSATTTSPTLVTEPSPTRERIMASRGT